MHIFARSSSMVKLDLYVGGRDDDSMLLATMQLWSFKSHVTNNVFVYDIYFMYIDIFTWSYDHFPRVFAE